MAKKLENIFQPSVDEISQGFTINSWHVSPSVDAFTAEDAYDISISGSLNITGSSTLSGSVITPTLPDASSGYEVVVVDSSTKELKKVSSISAGSSGTSGTSGSSGTSGNSGTSGSSGTSGTSGSSGVSGTSGTSGADGDKYQTTSTTSAVLGTGNVCITVGVDLAYSAGQEMIMANSDTAFQTALVTSYDAVTGVLCFGSIITQEGTGTYTSWEVNLSGNVAGSSGTSGSSGFLQVSNTGDDRVLTMDGNGNGVAESNLTFNGTLLNVLGDVVINDSLDVGQVTYSKYFHETYNDIGNSSGGTNISLITANNFRIRRTGTITISITGAPSGPRAIGFTLVMEDGSGGTATINWPSVIQWANGVAPTLTANGKDILVFYTYDGGSSYYGFLSANNIS